MSNNGIPGRTTMYRGIKMRSRLEADFAAFLDRAGAEWEYEPVCFGGPSGQWLPDFCAQVPDAPRPVYFEVKPESFGREDVDSMLERMTVAWLTEPQAYLQLVIWTYEKPAESWSIFGFPHEDEEDDDLIWWVEWAGADKMMPWPGMGQLERFIEEARAEQAGQL